MPAHATAAPAAAIGVTPPQLDVEFENKFYDQVQATELERLRQLARLTGKVQQLQSDASSVQQMTLASLFQKTIDTMVHVLEDLTKGRPLQDVFLADDRVMYIGIVLIVAALCLYLVDVTG